MYRIGYIHCIDSTLTAMATSVTTTVTKGDMPGRTWWVISPTIPDVIEPLEETRPASPTLGTDIELKI